MNLSGMAKLACGLRLRIPLEVGLIVVGSFVLAFGYLLAGALSCTDGLLLLTISHHDAHGILTTGVTVIALWG